MKSRVLISRFACSWLVIAAFTASLVLADESAPSVGENQPAQRGVATDSQAAASSSEIAQWIAELDDNRYLIREQATRRLMAAGEPAFDPLLAAANGDRLEPADRAIWVLQKLGRSEDPIVALHALTRLVQLRERPNLVTAARGELLRVSFLICKRKLEALGADVTSQLEAMPTTGMVANVVQVQFGDKWQGTTEDLKSFVGDTYHQHFRLMGQVVDDAVVKLFESKPDLAWLQLMDTKVTVAAIESLKAQRPNAEVYVRNQALLGLAARNLGAGLSVLTVQGGSGAAAAGIREGDVILSLNGHAVVDFDRMTAHIAQHKPGDKIQLEIQRGNEKLSVAATLGSWAGQPQ